MLRTTILIFAAVALASATEVNECDVEGIPFHGTARIRVSDCTIPPCKLKQGTTTTIEIFFTPKHTIDNMTNQVSAILFDTAIPFIGVDGTDACANIYAPSGVQVGCPLQENTPYVYRNSFPVLRFYPRVALTVRYALLQGNNEVVCFSVPAKITK